MICGVSLCMVLHLCQDAYPSVYVKRLSLALSSETLFDLNAASCIKALQGFVAVQAGSSPIFHEDLERPKLRKRLAMGRFRDLRKQNVVCCFRLDRIWIRTDSGQWLLDRSC